MLLIVTDQEKISAIRIFEQFFNIKIDEFYYFRGVVFNSLYDSDSESNPTSASNDLVTLTDFTDFNSGVLHS